MITLFQYEYDPWLDGLREGDLSNKGKSCSIFYRTFKQCNYKFDLINIKTCFLQVV